MRETEGHKNVKRWDKTQETSEKSYIGYINGVGYMLVTNHMHTGSYSGRALGTLKPPQTF